ncbi:uncharacterized protein CELE_F55H12.7 [Caenorhabditis elegans]|uniref:Uncharacterized protein n=2 Tax=Caenorhabditis elegans TaxID=6239 RepID=H2L2G0_CAEEL|nr:Uncharacterized protein CELE_F55H12.7 [Caenorhabditis elegans]CCE71760.1 Uncharacterized protein CELE_F55H12.7 [Caenorhabditis elegans]|eukprot:NP_001250918.1 Uncharacterized protein CELE_F55H12.7 [Caenorhabditis elegans]
MTSLFSYYSICFDLQSIKEHPVFVHSCLMTKRDHGAPPLNSGANQNFSQFCIKNMMELI